MYILFVRPSGFNSPSFFLRGHQSSLHRIWTFPPEIEEEFVQLESRLAQHYQTLNITKKDTFNNKTKYFRLRLTDEVSSERPKN